MEPSSDGRFLSLKSFEKGKSVDETTLANMRLRIERCRRLARSCTDDETTKALLQMADDGEADVVRMIAAAGASSDRY